MIALLFICLYSHKSTYFINIINWYLLVDNYFWTVYTFYDFDKNFPIDTENRQVLSWFIWFISDNWYIILMMVHNIVFSIILQMTFIYKSILIHLIKLMNIIKYSFFLLINMNYLYWYNKHIPMNNNDMKTKNKIVFLYVTCDIYVFMNSKFINLLLDLNGTTKSFYC